MTQQDSDDWLARLQKKLTAGPAPTAEEAAMYAAERKAEENTRWEWAQMQENGDISIRITYRGENGAHGVGEYVIASHDEQYAECKSEYRLTEPGDTRSIKKRLKENDWVIELDRLTNSLKPESQTESQP